MRPSLEEIARLDADVAQGALTPSEAIARLDPASMGPPLFQLAADSVAVARFVPAAPGIARGVLATSLARASALVADGLSVVLATDETEAEDVPLMQRLSGVIALASGVTGHAAIVSRALGLPCVLGSARAHLAGGALVLREAETRVEPESFVGFCGATGAIFATPFAHVGPTQMLAMVQRWLDAAGVPQIEASVVTDEERAMAEAIGLSPRTLLREHPDDPARLSRVAPAWPRPGQAASAAPVPVVRAVATRLQRARSRS